MNVVENLPPTDPPAAELAVLRQRVALLEQELARQRVVASGAASAERLRQVIQSMPAMLLAYDETREHIIVWNRECERVTGFSAEEIVGNSYASRLLYPDDAYRAGLLATWRAMGDNYLDLEWDITCKDGTVRTTAWSNIADRVPIPGWGTWALGVDVTARKRAEAALQAAHAELERRVQERTAELADANASLELEIAERKLIGQALRQSEERLHRVLENMPVMLVAYDAEANSIQVWNKECERVTGYAAAEIVGRPGREINLILYPNEAYLRQLWQEMTQRGDNYRDWEWEWRCKDGSFKTIAWSNITAQFPIPGWATWAVGIDVTERKKAQQRVIELAIEQERVQMLEQFIGDSSHDLKTPLMTMKLSLAVIRKTDDSVHRMRHMDILDAQVRHLERAVEDLLAIARLEKTSQTAYQLFDLNTITHNIFTETQPMAERRLQTMRIETHPGPLAVVGDSSQITRAITNLVMNAINYTPEEGTIVIRTTLERSFASVEVEDTGIGISEGELPYIFRRFYRADRARSTNTGGMGLGLAIVKKTVEAHDGRVSVRSVQGKGSTFRILLPLADDEDSPEPG
jgi:PAS domain S-box-containing protein